MRSSRHWLILILCALLLIDAVAANALGTDSALADQSQEARAKAMFYEIRCVVCQGESVAESPAAVASDMRRVIREKVAAGETDESIKAYLVSRYGDVILMRPPLKQSTFLLWFGPALILTIALFMAYRYFRKKPS
jgi:cytochrome c-type biogenesis protein CcmH